jgi:glycosyltransferase involved in cell wall biosynthesis
MRILNVSETYAPFLEFGGPPVKVHALSEHLARRGHQVSVLTADWGVSRRLPLLAATVGAERSPFGWRLTDATVEATYLPTWLRYRAVSWNPAVHRYCRARLGNFDVVHIFGLYDLLGPAVAAACRSRGLPYVVEPIGMFLPIIRNIWLKRMYHALLGRTFLGAAGALVGTSDQEVAELVKGGIPREKIVLRPNGVSVPAVWPVPGAFRSAQGIAPDAKLVLFLGRLSSKKSPELLLSAFARLPEMLDGGTLQLVFAGPDEDRVELGLRRQAAQLGVSRRVRFTGPLFADAKWSAYRDADVFVLPSQNENFGNTAAEAVAAETPVIVTEQCGIAPFLRNRAGLVVAHDEEDLSRALSLLFSDRQLYDRLVAGCAAVTAELGWAQPVQQMEQLYDEVIRNSGRTE